MKEARNKGLFNLYAMSRKRKFIIRKQVSVCPRLKIEAGIDCKWRKGVLGDDGNVLKLDYGDGDTIL